MTASGTDRPGGLPVPWRLFWLVILSGHIAAALAWFALMPGGFPIDSPRFWSNRVAPIAVVATAVAAVNAARRHRPSRLRRLLLAFPTAWASAAIVGRVLFPISSARFWHLPLLAAGVMALGAWWPLRRREASGRWGVAMTVSLAAILGGLAVASQRAPAPDTRPLGGVAALALDPPGAATTDGADPGRIGDRLRVALGDGGVYARLGSLKVEVRPLLEFFDRSPDRCWTILAPAEIRDGPPLVLDGLRRTPNSLELAYRRDGPIGLVVEDRGDAGPITIEATARIPRPIFSHLNTFCDLRVSGHRRLSVTFSPCPEARLEVLPADYPTGRPLRIAALGRDGTFRVVEAASGEKGPFRTLGSGPLRRGDPLSMTLYDGDRPAVRVTLLDWSAQTGSRPSPSAGWGLPVNAIEFLREGDAPESPAAFYVTLAGTSVGRGWDSVGHRPGGYRNRIRVEVLDGP